MGDPAQVTQASSIIGPSHASGLFPLKRAHILAKKRANFRDFVQIIGQIRQEIFINVSSSTQSLVHI